MASIRLLWCHIQHIYVSSAITSDINDGLTLETVTSVRADMSTEECTADYRLQLIFQQSLAINLCFCILCFCFFNKCKIDNRSICNLNIYLHKNCIEKVCIFCVSSIVQVNVLCDFHVYYPPNMGYKMDLVASVSPQWWLQLIQLIQAFWIVF